MNTRSRRRRALSLMLVITLLHGCLFQKSDVDDDDAGNEADVRTPEPDGSSPLPDSSRDGSIDPTDVSPPADAGPPVDVGPGDWLDPSFRSRVWVNWDRSGGDVDSFVVPIPLGDFDSDGFAFYDGEGTRLPTEIDGNTAWVRLRTFPARGQIRMYFGGGQPDSTSPWSSDHVAVWHLSSAEPGRDSKGSSTLDGANASGEGIVGEGAQMADDRNQPGNTMTAPALGGLSFPQGDLTVELWFRLETPGGQSQGEKLFNANSASGEDFLFATFDQGASDYIQVGAQVGTTTESRFFPFPGSGWHHLAIVRAGAEVSAWLDGVKQGDSVPVPADWAPVGQQTAFGSPWGGGGQVDEIRIHNNARASGFLSLVSTVYRNPDFISFVGSETRP